MYWFTTLQPHTGCYVDFLADDFSILAASPNLACRIQESMAGYDRYSGELAFGVKTMLMLSDVHMCRLNVYVRSMC